MVTEGSESDILPIFCLSRLLYCFSTSSSTWKYHMTQNNQENLLLTISICLLSMFWTIRSRTKYSEAESINVASCCP